MTENPYATPPVGGGRCTGTNCAACARPVAWNEGYAAGRADTLAVARDLAAFLRSTAEDYFNGECDCDQHDVCLMHQCRVALAAFDALEKDDGS